MDKDTLNTVGTILVVSGALAASPIDEAIVAAATGGVGAVISPVQGTTTFVGGVAAVAVGATMLYVANRKKNRR